MITTYTPTFEPMPDWLQEALSRRHSPRAVIIVGLEDGRFAVLDELRGPKERDYAVCESLSDVEKQLSSLRDRTLRAQPTTRKDVNAAITLLESLGLLK